MIEEKILLVDDDPGILSLFSYTLKSTGYSVYAAASGAEALEILQHNNIQVMFLDLNMPGMNGVELCRRIRQERPISIIYAVTGYTSLFELSNCREIGFDDYFPKPVPTEIIKEAARDAFKKLDRWGNS